MSARLVNVWLGMLAEVPLMRPDPSLPYDSLCSHEAEPVQWTTPLGLLCQIAVSMGLWKHAHPPCQLEYPPSDIASLALLWHKKNAEGEAVGLDIDWINAMTDAGTPYPQISSAIRILQAERLAQQEKSA